METLLITNACIFDGNSDTLTAPMSVLVEGDKITKIATTIRAPKGAMVIDATGRTLTPGFIDAHVHISMQVDFREVSAIDEYYFAFVQQDEALKMLMRGFTTARDTGGNTFSLKRAIDEGRFPGPRLYPSGAVICQTGGHVDYRTPNAIPRPRATDPETMVRVGHAVVADGEAEMLIAAREQLRRGATQVKITAGGGAASPADPLDTVQFTPWEVRAVVRAAQNWHTYVAAHVYNNEGIRMCVENGVESIEHANFIDEPTLDLIIAKGVWLSVQTLVFVNTPAGMNEGQIARFKEAATGLDNMFKLIKAKGYRRVAFGTDIIGDSALLARQGEEFTNRAKWFSNSEVLRQATSANAELLAMSGPRNPYPGKLGVIEEGAYADLLLVNGDPLKDISILTRPEENLALIMKDGKIYKNKVN
ncbi:Imidazolonepropionase [Propionicimonas sp. T2.31MG-18]|uniref:metal-dependent hydrolase family protein n=1 Tax=Propionicimonas sp. T2.31MG-18 TaxID=3157620 RepID=UPI0035EAA356